MIRNGSRQTSKPSGAMRIVQAYEVWQTYGEFVTRENPEFGPGVRERMMFAASVTGDAAAAAT
jgi:amidase